MASFVVFPGSVLKTRDTNQDVWHKGTVTDVSEKKDGKAVVMMKYHDEDDSTSIQCDLSDNDFDLTWKFENEDLQQTIHSLIVSEKRLDKMQQLIDQLDNIVQNEEKPLDTSEDVKDEDEDTNGDEDADDSDLEPIVEKRSSSVSRSPVPIILSVFVAWVAVHCMRYYMDVPPIFRNATKTNIFSQ